ncbi:MAG TPA: adenosylmethionine--8-amino-7-oxononanoate transaminase, partial [Lentisphaeria bacterium]|nr:adenosylmethionine--8-amino-7-oxononanoate transaminase [Lentisphaeria bacterium]
MNPSPIWHPCSQMKDYETFQPLDIVAAEGPWIELADGHRLLDAVSSWWCKSLGHGHPRLKAALTAQLEQFEHVILANTTNAPIRELSTRLTELCGLEYVFYAGDGATAVEIAVKMAIQAQ